ncbi:MAG: hypothetical protein JNG84_01850 [Archangium sp.]|nr:hypothetical protein [Archangium sp.]
MSAIPPACGPDSVLRVLSTLEVLPAEATGALVFGAVHKMSGVVLLERGRVCWAAAQGLQKRLTDLLRGCCTPPLEHDAMERLFNACRTSHTPVGEALVELGHVSPEALRSALLHHTAESLASISTCEAAHWVEHRARGYQSAYTFCAVELLSYASTSALGEVAVRRAHGKLVDVAGASRDSAVFDPEGQTLLACTFAERSSSGLRALRVAGSWAAETLGSTTPRSDILKFTFDGQGGSWLGWRDAGLTFLVHCHDRADFSSMVRRLHRDGWTSAVQSSVPLGNVASSPSVSVPLPTVVQPQFTQHPSKEHPHGNPQRSTPQVDGH